MLCPCKSTIGWPLCPCHSRKVLAAFGQRQDGLPIGTELRLLHPVGVTVQRCQRESGLRIPEHAQRVGADRDDASSIGTEVHPLDGLTVPDERQGLSVRWVGQRKDLSHGAGTRRRQPIAARAEAQMNRGVGSVGQHAHGVAAIGAQMRTVLSCAKVRTRSPRRLTRLR